MLRDLSASGVEKTQDENGGLVREARSVLATLAKRSAKFIQQVRSGRCSFEDVEFIVVIEVVRGAHRKIEASHILVFEEFILVLVGEAQIVVRVQAEVQAAE